MKFTHLVRGLAFAAPNPLVRRQPWLPLGAAALILGSAPALLAQASSGITGTVTDPSGAVIPGANITITNTATSTSTKVVSDSAGTYTVTGLVLGRYTITATAPGFSTTVQNDVNVEVTVQSTIDIHMIAGGTDQTVEVTSNLITLNTTQPELGTTIEPTVVAALPVAVSGGRTRQIDQLQFLAPGTQGSTFSHQVNGGVNFEEEILYNGIPAPQSETAGYTTNFNPPFELVNEFRVERSTFSAKYGLAQGAVTYQTASGTNSLHGDAFYINRNEFFDAKPFFTYGPTPTDRENDYGFTVGGPAVFPHLYNGKDKTFFLFSLDFASTANTNSNNATVPTALEKTGDFSDFIDPNTQQLIPIYDPTTGQQFNYQGRPNVIDPARISALSASILPYIPDPDLSGLSANKKFAPNAFPTTQHIWGFTIDHNLTHNQSLHYAEWRDKYDTISFDNNPVVPITNPLQSAKNNPSLGSVWLLNYVNTLTPKLVLTAGVAWVGEINNQFNVKTGVNFPGVVPNYRGAIFPNIQFSGNNAPTNYGTASGWIQSVNRKLGLAGVTNFLWTKGRNTFNIGGEARRSYQDDNECQACGGQFNFSGNTTANPATLTGGSPFASFLLGQVDAADRIFANELKLRNLLIAPYIQDDIKINPKLTVNLGLRWDIMLPFKEVDNQIVFLDPNNPNPAAGNQPGVAARFSSGAGGVDRADIHFKNFGPRIGVAYELNEKTVLQAGYNLAYLNGGAYEYGTSKVATQYGNLLQGSYQVSSNGTSRPAYGSWDANPLPAPPNQAVTPSLGLGTQINYFDPKHAGIPPYLQQWNFNVQRQIPWNTFVQVAYIGNRALRIPGQLNPLSQGNPAVLLPYGAQLSQNINSQTPTTGNGVVATPFAGFAALYGNNATVARALSPFPQYNYVYNNFDNTGVVAYNGLQASVEKRFSNGLSFLTSYTLSRTMGNVDTAFGTFAALSENKYNLKPEYTVAGNDIRNNVKISGTYELPIGPGKAFINNKGLTGQIVGGIQFGFILQYLTGTPFGVGENSNPLDCTNCFNRPDRVAGVTIHSTGYKNLGDFSSGHSSRPVFTTSAFTSTGGAYVLGNAQRNYTELRNPGYYDEDIKAQKKFALGERVSFVLEMNYFNLLNRVQFNQVNNNANAAGFGFGNNIDNTANYGFVPGGGQQNNPRQGQLSGRITS